MSEYREPWSSGFTGSDQEFYGDPYELVGADGRTLSIFGDNAQYGDVEEIGERIVACLNFCRYMKTEEMTDTVVVPQHTKVPPHVKMPGFGVEWIEIGLLPREDANG